MEFSEFAKKLKPIIGGGASQADFTRTLFDAIVSDGGASIVKGYSKDNFKRYFSGKTRICKIAERISPYLEPEEFVDFIKGFEDAATLQIVEAFGGDIEGINPVNVGEKVAYEFKGIIDNAAKTAGRRTLKEKETIEPNETVYEVEPIKEDSQPILNQTNIVQNGDNCSVITSSGTVNINL